MRQIENYRQRISGPLLDRIEIHDEVPAVSLKELQAPGDGGKSSTTTRQRVEAARAIQCDHFGKAKTTTNAAMTSRQQKACCQLDVIARGYLEHAMHELHFSARAYDRFLKVARTLGGHDQIHFDVQRWKFDIQHSRRPPLPRDQETG